MQPSFVASEGSWMERRVGGRLNRVYPLKTLSDAGVPLCGGSDSPIEEPHVMTGVQAVVARPGFTPDQALDTFQALSLYTTGPAYASFQEDQSGTISPGKRADLVVLERNPLTAPVDELADVGVRAVMIGGEIRYEAS
jgi:predicted amidohydrolase YtcJ